MSTIDKAIKIARAQLQTLALVDLPPNKTPKYSNWALDKGKKYGFEVNTLLEACEIEGLGAF
jgi:leucyl aminopeptidase